mgnify:CR=1 FL=1
MSSTALTTSLQRPFAGGGSARRESVAGEGGGAGAAGVGMLALGSAAAEAANPAADKSADFARSSDGGATLAFLPKPKPIADREIKETLTFDVVVEPTP